MKDELLIKYLLKESTEEENSTVNAWLMADEANRTYFAQFEKIWLESKNLSNDDAINVDHAWLNFKDRTKNKIVVKKINPNYSWLRIAAVVMIALGSWVIYRFYGPNQYVDLRADRIVLMQNLPDGSELTLNKFTHISYAKDFKNNRNIKLDSGEVFFNVAKDKSKPFTIKIDKVDVQVIGTSFNIKHVKAKTEVIVETGIVKVSYGHKEIELHKGESVLIDAKTTTLKKNKVDDELYTYYRSNLFIANNMALSRLIEALNEAYDSKISLADAVKDMTITTTLRFGSLDYNLKNICETLDLKINRNGNEILLSKLNK